MYYYYYYNKKDIFKLCFHNYLMFVVDPGPFQLKDKASERQHGFNLQTSLQKASQVRLLRGYKIHVTPGVKPEPQQMKDIITCAGAQVRAGKQNLPR